MIEPSSALLAPLTRDEVVSVIEGRTIARRVPMLIHLWVHAKSFGEREAAVLDLLGRYPADIQTVGARTPQVTETPAGAPEYRYIPFDPAPLSRAAGLDEQVAMPDWSRLDEVIERFPRADSPHLFRGAREPDGRYRLGNWWFCLFERHWSIRGMTNALTDYYMHPGEVHRLFRALTDFYKGVIERGRRDHGLDGILTSDDLGTQSGPFFSEAVFNEFFLPYYRELFETAHRHGLHFWLHACGNIEPFIPGLIDAGLDVLHPIQKHTMDEGAIARRFGPLLTIFAGLDVQQVIPWGTAEEVRAEVRHLLDTFWQAGRGRCMLTAGNGINGDCPLESLEAFFDEAVTYGARIARRT